MTFGPHMTWFRRRFGIFVAALSACASLDAEPVAVDAVQQQVAAAQDESADVHPALRAHLVAHYDFEATAAEQERDRGSSGTPLRLVNGGAAMRVADGAHPLSTGSLQLRQNSPAMRSNDDWKAGLYAAAGIPTLQAFRAARGITVMGWFKLTGDAPAPNSNTADARDRYDAIGLAGVLTGDSDGHAARALLEVFEVSGELRLVALGRRIDGGASQTYASRAPFASVLPRGSWVFLAASFDFETGTIALYRNGEPLPGSYGSSGDPWNVKGGGARGSSATLPRGFKIGGSFPQNNSEKNACNCRVDSLMFLDAALGTDDIRAQYQHVTKTH